MVQLVKDYGKNLDWNVGSLFAHDRFMFKLFDVIKELGYENPIKYVFGSIPCLFQGGRIPPRDAEIEDAIAIMDSYNDRGVACRLTFSNTFLTEEDLQDELCNTLMAHLNERAETVENGIIVSSNILAGYIREKYENLQIIASQVKPSTECVLGKDSADYYNELFSLYDIIVVNPFKINDIQFLRNLKDHDRVEFIANHRCVPDCPMAKAHYEVQMKIGMKALRGESYDEEMKTLIDINRSCLAVKKSFPLAGNSYSQSDIELLIREGFTQFKIEGRDNEAGCFIRDLGEYIFVPHLYNRIAAAIMDRAI